MTIKDIGKNFGSMISKNSPAILTGLAVGGMVTTVIFAVKATPKAIRLLENATFGLNTPNSDNINDKLTKNGELKLIEKVKIVWRPYLPAAISGVMTIACIIGANSISQRRTAAIATMYGITEAAFKEYKDKVVETIGNGKEQKVRDEVAANKIKNNPASLQEVVVTGKGNYLFYDGFCGRYFRNDIEFVRQALNELNHGFLSDMFVTLNDFYYAIGLKGTKLGEFAGWDLNKDGLIELTYSTQLSDEGEPCIVINYDVIPRYIQEL